MTSCKLKMAVFFPHDFVLYLDVSLFTEKDIQIKSFKRFHVFVYLFLKDFHVFSRHFLKCTSSFLFYIIFVSESPDNSDFININHNDDNNISKRNSDKNDDIVKVTITIKQ